MIPDKNYGRESRNKPRKWAEKATCLRSKVSDNTVLIFGANSCRNRRKYTKILSAICSQGAGENSGSYSSILGLLKPLEFSKIVAKKEHVRGISRAKFKVRLNSDDVTEFPSIGREQRGMWYYQKCFGNCAIYGAGFPPVLWSAWFVF